MVVQNGANRYGHIASPSVLREGGEGAGVGSRTHLSQLLRINNFVIVLYPAFLCIYPFSQQNKHSERGDHVFLRVFWATLSFSIFNVLMYTIYLTVCLDNCVLCALFNYLLNMASHYLRCVFSSCSMYVAICYVFCHQILTILPVTFNKLQDDIRCLMTKIYGK